MRKMIACGLVLALCVAAALSLTACSRTRSAYGLMSEFCTCLRVRGVIYSPVVAEGDAGYVASGFFEKLYGEGEEWVLDFAVMLLSDLGGVSECGVFLCYTDYDATQVTDMLHRRIELIRSVSAVSGLRFPEEPFVYREGRAVVMCALDDAEGARAAWRAIL